MHILFVGHLTASREMRLRLRVCPPPQAHKGAESSVVASSTALVAVGAAAAAPDVSIGLATGTQISTLSAPACAQAPEYRLICRIGIQMIRLRIKP